MLFKVVSITEESCSFGEGNGTLDLTDWPPSKGLKYDKKMN